MGTSFHGGLTEKCGTGLCWATWNWLVYRSSVKGIRREDSLPGDPEGYVEKALELGVSLHRVPDG